MQKQCEKSYWEKPKQKRQEMAVKHWNEVKAGSITENDLLMKLRALAEKKQKKSVWGLWAKKSEKPVVGVEAPKKKKRPFQQIDQNQVDGQVAQEEKKEDDSKQVEKKVKTVADIIQNRRNPVQELMNEKLAMANKQLTKLQEVIDGGTISRDLIARKKSLMKEKEVLKKKLRKLVRDKRAQQAYRNRRKKNPAKPIRSEPGRPPLEEQLTALPDLICKIAARKCAADPRRRTEIIRCVQTIDELERALNGEIATAYPELAQSGFQVKRGALYLRLMPKRVNTIEGRRHVRCVPVARKPQFNALKVVPELRFTRAQYRMKDEITAWMAPWTNRLGNDDKANVAVGIPAATKQRHILCKWDAPVRLPPHQYVLASGYSLKPSVYCELATETGNLGRAAAVTYSGKTDVKIRVNKYDSSTANSHRVDLKRILLSDDRYKMSDGTVKPNLIMDTDGGPDWCCRFAGTQNNLIQLSRELDLDLTIVGHHPAGCSPEGRQERRMAPLSQDLTGLVLIHNKFGNALNSKHEVVDEKLDADNLFYAAEQLAKIWSELSINGYPVEAEAIHPSKSSPAAKVYSEEYKMKHCERSYYQFTHTKCDDRSCCKKMRSPIRQLIPGKFIPAPRIFTHADAELKLADPRNLPKKWHYTTLNEALALPVKQHIPPDFYNPKLLDKIKNLQCPICGSYHESKAAVGRHRRAVHKDVRAGDLPMPTAMEVEELGLETAELIIDQRGHLYLVLFEDGDAEWLPVQPNHKLLMDFKKRQSEILRVRAGGIPSIASEDLDDWITPFYKNL